MKPGLYANINAKKARIAAGSGEKMRSVGDKGAPTAKDFRESAKTAKPSGNAPVKMPKPVQKPAQVTRMVTNMKSSPTTKRK
jgi:hypothetical protein